MKLCGDEHISPKILRAIREIARPKGCEILSVYDLNMNGLEDETWISKFIAQGGTGFISGDRQMLKRDALVKQIKTTGIIAVFMPSEYASAKRIWQAAHMMFWWSKIHLTFETAERGSIWTVPKDFGNNQLNPYVQRIRKSERARLNIKETA